MECEIVGIYSYPVKSCHGSSVSSAKFNAFGVQGDRQLIVLRDGKLINQKELPGLARVVPVRISDIEIEFRAEGHNAFRHVIESKGETVNADLYGSGFTGIRQDQALNDWISEIVAAPVELAALGESFNRVLPVPQLAGFDGISQDRFVDVAPVLLTNESSLTDLNNRLEKPIPMNQFRPNIVVRGLEPWAEDGIQQYSSSELKLQRQSNCERCAVVSTDQHTGERHGEPLRTMRTFRKTEDAYSSGIIFGAYMTIVGDGILAVGDTLTV